MSEPTILDTKGLKCPLPVLKTRRAMKLVPPGGLLEVHATDPDSVKDMQAFCATTGDALVAWRNDGGAYVFLIKKAD